MYNYDQTYVHAEQPQMPQNHQSVPNVMMDYPEEQMQQNAQTGYLEPQIQPNFVGVEQTVTYDLHVPPFDIEDPLMRRQFFRKVFTILVIQNVLALPVIEFFVLCFFEEIPIITYYSFSMLGFLLHIAMYVFSDYRRYPPVNFIALILVTVFVTVQEGIYATFTGSSIAFVAQLIVILQLLALIVYSKQARFKFTNLNAILFALIMFLVSYAIVGVLDPVFLFGMKFWSVSSVIYFVYDMQLQLSGHHAYNLKAEEHIFGVTNLYADMPNLTWRLFRYFVVDQIIRMYKFFKQCCFAEVC